MVCGSRVEILVIFGGNCQSCALFYKDNLQQMFRNFYFCFKKLNGYYENNNHKKFEMNILIAVQW